MRNQTAELRAILAPEVPVVRLVHRAPGLTA
jgi:hypothetical protein